MARSDFSFLLHKAFLSSNQPPFYFYCCGVRGLRRKYKHGRHISYCFVLFASLVFGGGKVILLAVLSRRFSLSLEIKSCGGALVWDAVYEGKKNVFSGGFKIFVKNINIKIVVLLN